MKLKEKDQKEEYMKKKKKAIKNFKHHKKNFIINLEKQNKIMKKNLKH